MKVDFELPEPPAGSYFVDVVLWRGRKKANWGTAHLLIESDLTISQLKLSKEFVDIADGNSDTLDATAILTAGAPQRTVLCFSLFDNYYRLLSTKDLPLQVGATEGSATFDIKDFRTCLGKLRAGLRIGDKSYSVATASFTAIRRDWDRFTFLGWTAGPVGHQGNVYLRVLAEPWELGLDASRMAKLDLRWLEAADRVAVCPYRNFRREVEDPETLLRQCEQNATKTVTEQIRFDPLAFNTGDEFYYGGETRSHIASEHFALT